MRAGQVGCKALMVHYEIGELTAVTILAELGDCAQVLLIAPGGPLRRTGHHRAISLTSVARLGASSRQGAPGAAVGAISRPRRCARRGERSPDREYYLAAKGADRRRARVHRGRPRAAEALLPHAARARRGGTPTGMSFPVRAKPLVTRGEGTAGSRQSPAATPPRGRPGTPSGRNASPRRDHPIKHHVAGPGTNPRVADRSKAGRPRA